MAPVESGAANPLTHFAVWGAGHLTRLLAGLGAVHRSPTEQVVEVVELELLAAPVALAAMAL